tara:strand:+ start:629 stop:862 length:234 start_codon:yes stop_codon:yes gene_type:complete
MVNCQSCDYPNDGGWFFCRNCGERAHPPKFTTNSWMRGSMSNRTDIEFNSMLLEDSTNKMAGNKMNQRLKDLGVRPL